MNWNSPRVLRIESAPEYQTVKYFVPGFDRSKLTGARGWAVGAVGQLFRLRWRYGVDPLRPGRIVEFGQTAGTVKDEVILKRHVPNGNVVVGNERQVAVGPADGKQADETCIDLRRREPMKVAVIPVRSLRHVPGDVVAVGVGHSRRDVQQHVVGISLRTDVKSVGMEIQRRRSHLLRIDRNGPTLRGVLWAEIIPDGEAGEAVLEMDDQLFARKHLQRRSRIKIVA